MATLAAFVLATLYLPASTTAQEVESPAEKTEEAVQAPAKPGEDAKPDEAWERLIYLPYQNLRDVFDKRGATVFLPYLEYLKLWEKAAGVPLRPDKPPVAAVITEAHYVARVEKNLARIEATLTIQVLDKPWAEVPVKFGDAAVGEIDSSDNEVLLRGTGDGTYSILLPKPGEHKVRLELVARVRTSPDGRSFELATPTVGITTFELTIPEADQTVDIQPRLVSLPVEPAKEAEQANAADQPAEKVGGQTRVKANLGSTEKIVASWHPRAGIKPDMALLTSVTNTIRVAVADGLIHTSASLEYDVLRGELTQVQIAVPADDRILDVAARDAKVKGWKAAAEENRQVVTVDLLGNVEKKITLEVHTERPAPTEAFEIIGIDDDGRAHGIHALDAVRESGQLIVTHGKDLSLAVEQQSGLTRVDAGDVPPSLRGADALYYKFYSPRVRLNLSAHPVEPRIFVEQNARLVFRTDELQLHSDLAYTVDRAGVFELSIRLPENLTVDNVTADGLSEFTIDEASRTLKIALVEKRLGALGVSVTAHRSLAADEADAADAAGQEAAKQTLPILEPLGVTRETGRVSVFAPEAIEVISDEAALSGAHPVPAGDTVAPPNTRFVAAWTYHRRPVEIAVKTLRKPTRLTAKVATAVNVKQELIEVDTILEYLVEHAGIDTFRFAVPEAVADRVQITVAAADAPNAQGQSSPATAIKQKSRAEEAQDGWVAWTVVMQQDVSGVQRFRVKYDLKPKADEKSKASELILQPLRALDPVEREEGDEAAGVALSSVEGEIVVTNDRALSVTAAAVADVGELEPIDVRELRLLPRDGFLAYRYFKQPVELKVAAMKYEIQPVVETVVSRALVEIVLGRDPMATYRCRYRLTSSERQRLRIDLPKDAELLGILVDRQQVTQEKNTEAKPEDNWDSLFVNVARGKPSDEPFSLTVLFRAPVGNELFAAKGGRLDLRLPRIGNPEQASVVLQHLKTVVWVPDETTLVGTPDEFTRETRSRIAGVFGTVVPAPVDVNRLEQWIGVEAGGIFDFPTEGHAYHYGSLGGADRLEVSWWKMPFLTWLLSGVVLLIGWVLRNTPWENKLSALLLTAFVAALYALIDADLVLHLLAAARYGIVAVLAFWLIHSLLGERRAYAGPPVAPPSPAIPIAMAAVVPPPGVFDRIAPKK